MAKKKPKQVDLTQPLTLGLLRSICMDLVADSAPSTKLVAMAVIRRIDGITPSGDIAAESGDRESRSRKR
jgi:hypothetical protein